MKNKIIYLATLLILLVPTASSQIITNIDIEDSFSLNEEITFTYTLTSDKDVEATIIPHITCPNSPIPPQEDIEISLSENIPYQGVYSAGKVSELYEPETCEADIAFIEPKQEKISKEFQIIIEPSFSFNILTCKDETCKIKSKVFLLEETIYLDYSSSVPDPIITATLTFSDKTTQQITLPKSIQLSQIGTYTLEATASKQDYKSNKQKIQFAVIEKNAQIQKANLRELKQELSPQFSPFQESLHKYYFIAAIVIILIIFLVLKYKKNLL